MSGRKPEPHAISASHDREAIARMIDRRAFDSWQGLYDYSLKDNDAEFSKRCANSFHGEAINKALAKADAILALRAAERNMIERCKDMLADIPGETLEQRLVCYIGNYMALQVEVDRLRTQVASMTETIQFIEAGMDERYPPAKDDPPEIATSSADGVGQVTGCES